MSSIVRFYYFAHGASIYNEENQEAIENESIMALEYCENGSFINFFLKYIRYSHLNESLAKHFFKQIALAVKEMHDFGYAHLDLKHDNLVLDKDLNIKLIDFGYTLKTNGEMIS